MSVNPFDLSGKVALVTGANTGLGQAMALALAQAGANIVLIGRSAPVETLEQLAKLGVKTHSILTNLNQTDAVTDIVAEAVSTFGQVDILVNNAGIIKRNEALDFTPEGRGYECKLAYAFLSFPSFCTPYRCARENRESYKYRFDADVSGGYSCALIYGIQKWGGRPYKSPSE